MKVTKFVHSCLLVETGKINILIDPGRYTWSSHLLHINGLPRLDHIVITHEHADHYDEQGLKKLSHRFPHTTIITNDDLAKKIKILKLPNPVHSGSDENLVVFEAPHEPLPFNTPVPLNIGVHIEDKLTHPGDALDFKHSREILALPVSAPSWTNLKNSLEAAAELQPKKILPLHDWHWHKSAREEVYGKIKNWLDSKDIEFIELENAEPVEL